MSKRYTKKISKKIFIKNRKTRKMRKMKYGGESNPAIVEEQERKNAFRRNFKDSIIQITNKKKINEAINSIIRNFTNNHMINTLIPVSATGKPLDVKTYTSKNPIVDFVSPVIVIFDNLTGIVNNNQLIKLLNVYFTNGGNFNAQSNRFKITPIENEINKGRINNVKILLDHSNPFHIIEDGLNEETKIKLAELIPTEQKIISEPISSSRPDELIEQVITPNAPPVNLTIPYPLPENNDEGYDRNVTPEFWKPIFQSGEELMELRETFMNFYEKDKYTENVMKPINICVLLEKFFPGYLTKMTLDKNYTIPKHLVTANIINCITTLLYGMITYKLYEFKQDYLILFKGGRALQLSLNDIPTVLKYFSEDTDILIIPNETINAQYNLEKMLNLSGHIAYLIKWFIPSDINIIVSLPSNPNNQNKEITKLIYTDGVFKRALSDIGFGEIKEELKVYFENPNYSQFYIDLFKIKALFITPTIDNMLDEKLYFYSIYSNMYNRLKNGEQIHDKGYEQVTLSECKFFVDKFYRAIKHLVSSILKRDYVNLGIVNVANDNIILISDDYESIKNYPFKERERIYKNVNETSRLVLRGIVRKFDNFSNEEKNRIINELYP